MEAELIDALAGLGAGAILGRETEDLDVTLLAWPAGRSMPPHVNAEVDVVSIVLSGEGLARIAGLEHVLKTGNVLVIPKGVERSIESRSEDFRYLNVHKRRKRLMPTMTRQAPRT